VLRKQHQRGAPLFPACGILGTDLIAQIVGRRLLAHEQLPEVADRIERIETIWARRPTELGVVRPPFFCSGCPHNTSLVADDQAIVGARIGVTRW
jgi:indolepyruvate ferredoxin oxidoreductase